MKSTFQFRKDDSQRRWKGRGREREIKKTATDTIYPSFISTGERNIEGKKPTARVKPANTGRYSWKILRAEKILDFTCRGHNLYECLETKRDMQCAINDSIEIFVLPFLSTYK